MENIDDENKDRQKERILTNFYCAGLPPHNRSLEFLFEVLDDAGGVIDEGGGNHQYDADTFAIRVKGSSGTMYRITVNYRSRAARLMAERFHEIDFDGGDGMDEQLAIGTLMHAYRRMMDFAVHWYDYRNGNWEQICIHESRERMPDCWPGDHVASTILLLANDLRCAFEPPMNTLRRELRESYPVAWGAQQTPSDVTFTDVVKYVGYLERLANCESKEEAFEVRAEALKDLFDEEEEK